MHHSDGSLQKVSSTQLNFIKFRQGPLAEAVDEKKLHTDVDFDIEWDKEDVAYPEFTEYLGSMKVYFRVDVFASC